MISRHFRRFPSKQLSSRFRGLSTSASTVDSDPAAEAMSGASTMAQKKRMLARAALQKVPQHGWSQDAITAAVMEDPHMSLSMAGLFTPSELVNWLMEDFNQQLRDDSEKTEWSVFQKLRWRLEQVIPLAQSGHWHQGMAMGLSTPFTTRTQLHDFVELVAPLGSSIIYKTGLGGIFVASELHLLSDSSSDYEETWRFLQLRLNELEQGHFVNVLDSGNFPAAATTAVATSLFEGLTSLLAPPTSSNTPGTRASDYQPKKKF